jgi:hypothetical protein
MSDITFKDEEGKELNKDFHEKKVDKDQVKVIHHYQEVTDENIKNIEGGVYHEMDLEEENIIKQPLKTDNKLKVSYLNSFIILMITLFESISLSLFFFFSKKWLYILIVNIFLWIFPIVYALFIFLMYCKNPKVPRLCNKVLKCLKRSTQK